MTTIDKKKSSKGSLLCPSCHQDLHEKHHDGINGKNCPRCGQGIQWKEQVWKTRALERKIIIAYWKHTAKCREASQFFWIDHARKLETRVLAYQDITRRACSKLAQCLLTTKEILEEADKPEETNER